MISHLTLKEGNGKMSRINQNSTVSGMYQVIDSPKVALLLLFTLVIIGGGSYWAYSCYVSGEHVLSIVLILGISLAVGIPFFLSFKANKNGFIISIEDDVLDFPGGGLAPDSILSYFSPFFWLQYFKRFSLKISDIRQVDKYNKTTHSTGSDGKSKSTTKYYIDVDGEFGAVSFVFISKGKRDELYSLIMRAIQQDKESLDNDFPVEDYEA